MATEYFIMAGDQVVDQVDVSSSDRKFFNLIREIKSKLSIEAQAAFSVISEYEMYPDDGEPYSFNDCSEAVFAEIELAWLSL